MISNNSKKFLTYAAGIFFCYFYFGILQEKITRGVYCDGGNNNERFTYMFALVFVQCVVSYLFANLLSLTVMKDKEKDTTKTSYYTIAALTYFLAMVCSSMALKFVNYPTQVVGKAGKPIPVMILSVLLSKKSYPMKKYCFVFLVVLGVIMFMYKDGEVSTKQSEQMGVGELLLILSLTMDGLTSAVQERMRSEHKTKSNCMMRNMNFWSIIFSGIVIVLSGELLEFVKFIQRHPSSLWHILTFSAANALGQFFIYSIVAEFGPLPCSIITTTRKFFTVLASVVFFGNSLIFRQWIATVIVFAGLFLDAAYGKSPIIKKETVK